MSIRGRIVFGFAILLAFIATQFGVVRYYESRTRDLVTEAITRDFSAAMKLSELAVTAQAIRRYEKEFFIYLDDEKGRKKYAADWNAAFTAIETQLREMTANTAGHFVDDDLTEARKWHAALDFYGTEMRRIIDRTSALPPGTAGPGATLAANEAIRDGKDRFRELLDGATKLERRKQSDAAESSAKIAANFDTVQSVLMVITIAGVLLGFLLLVELPNQIANAVDALVTSADKLSRGEVDKEFAAQDMPEFAKLAASLERLRASQASMIGRMRSNRER